VSSTDLQILMAINTVPTAVLILGTLLLLQSRLNDVRDLLRAEIRTIDVKLDALTARVDALTTRVDVLASGMANMVTKDELRRMEEVFDARLKHIEEELDRPR
jgi:chaperonin cofactor prefoldin